jgi:hypothetical protein
MVDPPSVRRNIDLILFEWSPQLRRNEEPRYLPSAAGIDRYKP